MKAIFEPLRASYWCEAALDHLSKKEPFLVSGTGDSVQNHLSAAFISFTGRPAAVLCPNELNARQTMEELKNYFPGEVMYLPAKDPLYYQAEGRGTAMEERRMEVLKALYESRVRIVVLSVEALFDRMISRRVWESYIVRKKPGDSLELSQMLSQLVDMGYERTEQVEKPGEFSSRGGILDIFPAAEETAYRVELWGDEIDTIRVMDPQTQRSLKQADEMRLYPADEILINDEARERGKKRIKEEAARASAAFEREGRTEQAERVRSISENFKERMLDKRTHNFESYVTVFYDDTVTVLDYLPEESLLLVKEPARVRERMEGLEKSYGETIKERMNNGYLIPSQTRMFLTAQEASSAMQAFSCAYFCSLLSSRQDPFPIREILKVNSRSLNVLNGEDMLLDELSENEHLNYRTLVFTGGKLRAHQLVSDLESHGLQAYYLEDEEKDIPEGTAAVREGALEHGFSYPDLRFAVYSMGELTETSRHRRRPHKVSGAQRIHTFEDIKPGDYVVHENYGIGVYQGVVQMNDSERGQLPTKRDYFKVSYKDGGVLYVPTTSLDMLQKYVAAEGAAPRLNSLSGQDWQRTKTKVREGVKKLAFNLVQLYAERRNRPGFAFSKDTPWQQEFEDTFPFEETEDQLKAIEETKKDMESPHIMDRLICGDVGYGKTEIALRAAFKAVQDGKQVALLTPTTVLAQQHYNTFSSRMRDFPVNVGMLSRFQSPKEIKKTIAGLEAGTVDIVVGTHRLLGKDVKFKDLGLLIVDEEQRFGVSHKEKIQSIKKDVDVLTMSATPIPRTLHMSLTGMRDMSLLSDAPQDRHPVQTYVMEWDETIVKEAIYRELSRGGQVFYLHNRTESIQKTAQRIQQLVPEAKVAVAHGQMAERQLEDVMMNFVQGETNVLVCTTIIETGLDIPNANTLIVEDADRMGLSQLYQLRGRVGRSPRLAYAYFLYQQGKVLQEEAQNRLEAINELTDFGSGYKIALRDLQIRGAGNVLGPEQHGHMGAVGYELYTKMLNEAIAEVRGEKTENTDFETTVQIRVDAYIPSSYIEDSAQKLEIYKRIAFIHNEEDYRDMVDELTDRFGDLPRSVDNLLKVSLIRQLSRRIGCDLITYEDGTLTMQLRQDAPVDIAHLTAYLEQHKDRVHLSSEHGRQRLVIRIEKDARQNVMLDRILKEVKEAGMIRTEEANDSQAEREKP